MGLQTLAQRPVEPLRFLPALACVFAMLVSISGVTMVLSALGRSRARVWGGAISLFLGMFLINVVGQIWAPLEWLRPFTIYYHYQPQALIQNPAWYADGMVWFHLGVLLGIGAVGYLVAWFVFTRRDLPAPL
jgi:ABC-2 type transport system permease protein